MKLPKDVTILGDVNFRGECPLEGAEHVTLVSELRKAFPDTVGRVLIHPQNEGKRSRLKARGDYLLGLTKGASDIIIPGSPAIVIELKRKDHTKSVLSAEQVDYLHACQDQGCRVYVALGWKPAFEEVAKWQ